MVMSYSAQTTTNRAYFPPVGSGHRPATSAKTASTRGDLGPLEKIARRVSYRPDQAVCREGDQAVHCFRVISGTIRLCKTTEDGRRQIAAFLSDGDMFGWDENAAYRYTAEAVTHADIATIARAKVEDAVTAYPALGRTLLGATANQLAAAQEHLLLLGRKSAGERIATFFRSLALRAKARTGDGNIVMLPMTRVDIADYLGLTVETVSRMITWLRGEKIVTLLETDIVRIDDRATLDALAGAS